MLYLELLLGLGLLLAGGDMLVRGGVAIAWRLGISPLLIGLTFVGFATSTPELVTSLAAAFEGSSGIAFGNVVGSNIANVLLILGAAALIRPLIVSRRTFLIDGIIMLLATLVCVGLALYGGLERIIGATMLVLLIGYVAYTCWREMRGMAHAPRAVVGSVPAEMPATVDAGRMLSMWAAVGLAIAGLALTVSGAKLMVDASIDLARLLAVSEAVIGLTIVAVGTSLPELATSVMAAVRRQSDVAIGNIIGSNVFNVLGILGVTALVRPLAMDASIARFDVWIMLGAAILLLPVGLTGWRVSRGEGTAFLTLYGMYLGCLASI